MYREGGGEKAKWQMPKLKGVGLDTKADHPAVPEAECLENSY